MDFLNRMKGFLGLSADDNRNKWTDNTISEFNSETPREHPDRQLHDDYDAFGFNIFSNPLEMHRYFERQMNEVLKNFGFFNENSQFGIQGDQIFSGRGDPFFGDNPFKNDFSELPTIEDHHKEEKNAQNLRDQYLKSGYETISPNEQSKLDKDLDGKVDLTDFDSILKGRPTQVIPKTRFFGTSITSKTVRNPDGSYETHRTIRDHQGNEETTITRAQGVKKYTITTKVNPEGEREITEDMVNMDENDKDSFTGIIEKKELPPNWFPYDKFFK